MPLTQEQIEQIPKVYRDFMIALKPILDSRAAPVRINGIPRNRIFTILAMNEHPYDFEQVAAALKAAGLIEEDDLGFVTPTDRGINLIRDLAGPERPITIPPLPPLPW